nr:zinc finger, CCHC-type [Tanacetum cinerariifolium]
MDEAIQVSYVIDKLHPSWKDFKHTLKHLKEELTLIELDKLLCIEESLRVQDSDNPKGSNVAGPSVVNMVEHNNFSRYNDNKAFLNGKLDEEVYMNQPQGLIMHGNENKVDMTKEFLSSKFYMKDMGEADVTLVSTPMNTSEKLMPNNGQVVSQAKYSRVIGCVMYAMTCTRPDIAFAVGKLSRYTSNPRTQHWMCLEAAEKEDEVFTSQWMCLEAAEKEDEVFTSQWYSNRLKGSILRTP